MAAAAPGPPGPETPPRNPSPPSAGSRRNEALPPLPATPGQSRQAGGGFSSTPCIVGPRQRPGRQRYRAERTTVRHGTSGSGRGWPRRGPSVATRSSSVLSPDVDAEVTAASSGSPAGQEKQSPLAALEESHTRVHNGVKGGRPPR